MAGFSSRHGHLDGFSITQFADQDHVRVLAQRGANAIGKGRQMGAEFALDNLRLLAAVDELDRVFETDDVGILGAVEMIDHRRQGGRLAGTCRAGHQDHALMMIAKFAHYGRQIQAFKCRHFAGNEAEGGADAGFLAEHIDAKAAAVFRYIGEIEVMALVEAFALVGAQDLGNVAFQFGIAEVAKLDRHEIAVHAQHRRHTHGQMDVRAALCEPELEECVDACHQAACSSASRSSSIDA